MSDTKVSDPKLPDTNPEAKEPETSGPDVTRFLPLLLLWAIGIVGGAALVQCNSPLAALQDADESQKFLYADENCGFSQRSLALLEQNPDVDVVVVPVRYRDSTWANQYCATALERLGGLSRLIWHTLVPADFACGRLIAEAQEWHSVYVPDEGLPVWGEGSNLIGAGLSNDNLRRVGLPEVADAQ